MRKGLTLLEMLVVMVVVAILIALLVPAIQKVRELSLLTQSQNNMRQICLALHNLGDANKGRLPGTVSSHRPYRRDAFVEILPYLERADILQKFTNPPPGFWGSGIYKLQAAVYLNPLDPSYGRANPLMFPPVAPDVFSVSSYAMNAQFFAFYPNLNTVTDGLSQTIWLAEHYAWDCNGTSFVYTLGAANRWKPIQPATFAHGGPVAGRPAPGDYYPTTMGIPPVANAQGGVTFQVRPKTEDCDPRQANASLSQGLQVAFGDGTVRLLRPNIASQVYWGLVTHNGGEIVQPD